MVVWGTWATCGARLTMPISLIRLCEASAAIGSPVF